MKQATLHQLKVFEAAARHGSFTRAAEELFLTQPTVSMQVKQLTKAVGLPLFEQVGKRLYLTDAGRELLLTCREIFERQRVPLSASHRNRWGDSLPPLSRWPVSSRRVGSGGRRRSRGTGVEKP